MLRAAIFPGQGSQFVGMGASLFKGKRSALLDEAEAICKVGLRKLILEGPLEELTRPSIAQPAILVTSLAYYYQNNNERGNNDQSTVFLGHSLGEYTALAAAGILDFRHAISLVQRRGLAMEECMKSSNLDETGFAMSAIILTSKGKERFSSNFDEMIQFVQDSKQVWNSGKDWVNLANINSSSQVVLSGTRNGVDAAAQYLQHKQLAARAVNLPVGAPFHSKFMKTASDQLADYIKGIKFNTEISPSIIISNVTAKPDTFADLLLQGIYSPVRWYPSILYAIKELKVREFVEYGPRPVLGNLLKREQFPTATLVSFKG